MRFFKRHWDNSTGELPTNSWGESDYYFETDSNLNVLRQIQIFKNGNILKYSNDFIEDEYGGLADQNLEEDEFSKFEITKEAFDIAWNNSKHFLIKKKWWKIWRVP